MLCVTIITYLNECTILSYTNNNVQEYEKTKNSMNNYQGKRDSCFIWLFWFFVSASHNKW